MHSEKVPYYILDLLQQVPSVTVQGLGRFDAIFHPAIIDSGRQQIKPPRIEPGFESNAQEAEEILPAYIHYVSGIDISDAISAIRSFSQNVHHRLSEGLSHSIEKFGTFTRSSKGIIHFTPDWDAFNLAFTGLEDLDIDVSKDEPSSRTDTHQDDFIYGETPAAIENTLKTGSETNWVTDKEDIETDPVAEESSPAALVVISDSTSRLWWTILATALVLITFLCGYLAWDILSNKERVNQYIAITNDTIASNTPDILFIDTLEFIEEPLPEDTPQVEAPVLEEPVVEPQKIEKPCYVVVGAFTNTSNVERMEQRLSSLGYRSKLIKGGSLTRVAIETMCDKSTLEKTLNDARSSINPEAWIY